MTAIGPRRHAGLLTKHREEMRAAAEAALTCNFAQRQIAQAQQALSGVHPCAQQQRGKTVAE